MDAYEATRIVFSRIQNLDPENASKIMGLLLIQDHGDKEMIRLAFGPEALVHSLILKARKELGLPSNSPPTPSTPPSPSPYNPLSTVSRQNSFSSRLGVNLPSSLTIPNPSSSSSWSALSDLPTPDDLISPSGASSMNSSALPFYGNGNSDMIDEFQLQEQLSFLNDNTTGLGPKNSDLFYSQQQDLSTSPTSTDSMLFPSYWGGSVHRRSCSVSDVLGADDSGFGWRPCLYYARGYCKNGSNCKFVHGGLGESGAMMGGADCAAASLVGSPSKIEMMDQCHELLRSKSAHHQQRLAAASQLMGSSFPFSPKCMNFLLQQQQSDSQRAAAALIMGDDIHKFGRSRLERNSFSLNVGAEMVNPASRQIYLTFPADSTFREEDVSNYFSIYGPVQDVRIPYQQKRMFGFVTFMYPETVKLILAKGNPHFVCDARVLVKPYKEKGKVPDKYRNKQQVERAEFSPCGTPTGLDSRDPFDLQLGARMFCNTQDMLWRRKLEESADLQQALELQSRRLMGLQLLDVKKHHHHRALSTGSPIPSPTHSPNLFNQSLVLPPFHSSQEVPQENCSSPMPAISISAPEKQNVASGNESTGTEENSLAKESSHDVQESLEHNLPDSPFASPIKGSGEYLSGFSNLAGEAEKDVGASAITCANNNVATSTLLPSNASLDMASFKSFNCQMPRFSSGHGATAMYAGTGGPTCPLGI
ncbi:zf-CCCH domain-containing protein/RRM_6 domain-containing protein [Cephalotus follicularis]|uniref:Zf-CCCH domain-containing protein/RRM_6 domain-containing protein n=1 Tax=Cephalotus follicularis TaxID=3775 RepID=A0A1Q3BN55_CEPFO|nr:zf-CCCH domain-containing protein/RRM_6 domain-containing protein [Cephalotus follicularis]